MPLSVEQRRQLERRLLEERERATTELGRLARRFAETEQDADGDLSNFPFHPADQGTDEFDRQLDSAEESRLSRELAEIDAALERLYGDPERFGRDERTGDEIPFERLELIPWARRRVDEHPAP
jgi:RNA polymerase-binding transcription factor DksA